MSDLLMTSNKLIFFRLLKYKYPFENGWKVETSREYGFTNPKFMGLVGLWKNKQLFKKQINIKGQILRMLL